jgi:cellulose synthase/poly-beta-1,6-N-acetylglucosamine synthase-like glycosyltransferase
VIYLSVVIIGRNEGERLLDCIRSIQAMNFPLEQVEIIYVDSNSKDDSVSNVKTFFPKVKVLLLNLEHTTAALARNMGWRAAQAEFVLFIDGDTVLQPDFIKNTLPIFANEPKVAIIWGHYRERYPFASIYQRAMDLDWIFPAGYTDICGGITLMRVAVLKEIEGFNEKLIAGEEIELCQRVIAQNYLILHVDSLMVLHDLAITRWSQYWQRAVRSGHAYAQVSTSSWRYASLKNFLHASVFICIFLIGIIALLGGEVWIFLLSLLPFLLLSIRTAWKARWKSSNLLTLLLYGLHSQFIHIPIALGQLLYQYRRLRKSKFTIIEYK